jgi:GTP pyrophosphokinase
MYEAERRIDVEWTKATEKHFPVHLTIYSEDRAGMLHQITNVLHQENCNIRSLEARPDPERGGDSAIIEMNIEIRDKKQLERITAAMRRISGIRDVERVQ